MKRRVALVNGLRHGKDEIWNEAGILVDTAEFKEGRPVGIHRRFSEQGTLIEEVEYLEDGTFRYWNPSLC
jgi:antitoxin component YwqK of YwqJK toxin-antitoxin module